MYLAWLQDFEEDPAYAPKRPKARIATIQRLNNRHIHIRSNCADVLICAECNGILHGQELAEVGSDSD